MPRARVAVRTRAQGASGDTQTVKARRTAPAYRLRAFVLECGLAGFWLRHMRPALGCARCVSSFRRDLKFSGPVGKESLLLGGS